jgi:hypothetical protein
LRCSSVIVPVVSAMARSSRSRSVPLAQRP